MTSTPPNPGRPIRWGIARFILVLGIIALAIGWNLDRPRQTHVLISVGILLGTLTLLHLWFFFLSRISGQTKLKVVLGGIALSALLVTCFKQVGVTGDLIPIFGFRFRQLPTLAKGAAEKPTPSNATDGVSFPQFLGPNRNGIITGLRLETNWAAHPPQELWRHPVGSGWTGFAVEGGLAITQEQRGSEELVTAYDLLSGQSIWSHADATRYATTIAGEGPRAFPTIHGGRVYTLGGNGILNCLDRATGKQFWTKDLVTEHAATVPDWGYAGAPLVHNGAAIVNAGGKTNRSVVAYDAMNGKLLWGSGDNSASYSSPTVLTLAGTTQIVLFNHRQVEGYAPNGSILWTYPWPTSHPHIAMPIQISANQLLVSSGYGYGSELLELSSTNNAWKADRIWKSNRLKTKFANLILHNNYVYGLDDGILACLDPKTGERKWHGSRLGHGQLLLVENIILMTAENGEILLVDPSPTEERIIARLKVFKSKTWNPPALAGPYFLVRNDLEAACFKLPLAGK